MIKRYWWSLLVGALVIVSIGLYYILAAPEPLPQLVLKHQSGEEHAADNLLLYGYYSRGGIMNPLTVTSEGTSYSYRQSLLKEAFNYRGDVFWKDLIDRYPRFMRSKDAAEGFYEDDSKLVYAGTKQRSDWNLFEIAILDKKTGKTFSYTAEVPDNDKYETIEVFDVQVVNGLVKIMTRNYNAPANTSTIHLYTCATEEKSVVSDRLLFSEPAGKEKEIRTSFRLYLVSGKNPNRYTGFQVEQRKETRDARGAYSNERISVELFLYDLQADQEVQLNSGEVESFMQADNITIELSGEYMTMMSRVKNEGSVKLLRYSIADGATTAQTLSFADKNISNLLLKNNRLYVMAPYTEGDLAPASVLVYDTATGSPVYGGTVMPKDSPIPEELLARFDLSYLGEK
ncbi:MAG: hypothetical protein K0R57_4890 [Paenibacillaceae bacterium]|jgi:hypothetical protein|nr:hypothetical protein [Paenibacillaceae bacterium]